MNNVKSDVSDKLDVDKLKMVPLDMKKHSFVVDNDLKKHCVIP